MHSYSSSLQHSTLLQPMSPRTSFTITKIFNKTEYRNHHHIKPPHSQIFAKLPDRVRRLKGFFLIPVHFQAVLSYPLLQFNSGEFQLASSTVPTCSSTLTTGNNKANPTISDRTAVKFLTSIWVRLGFLLAIWYGGVDIFKAECNL